METFVHNMTRLCLDLLKRCFSIKLGCLVDCPPQSFGDFCLNRPGDWKARLGWREDSDVMHDSQSSKPKTRQGHEISLEMAASSRIQGRFFRPPSRPLVEETQF
jgi:hypothetical protein